MVDLFFEIIQGPNKGQIIPIKPGYKLGNGFGEAKVEIKLPAKNILSLHAQIISLENGQLFLVALNPNHVFSIDSHKIDRIELTNGYIFKLEDMLIKVASKAKKNTSLYAQRVPMSQKPDQTLESLLQTCTSLIPKNSGSIEIQAFKSPLQMRFSQGLQFDESFIIGWGPRKFGKNTLEFSLSDPVAPDIAFTLSPGTKGEYVFFTKYPNIIFINGNSFKKAIVKTRDKIQFGDTIIELLELEYF